MRSQTESWLKTLAGIGSIIFGTLVSPRFTEKTPWVTGSETGIPVGSSPLTLVPSWLHQVVSPAALTKANLKWAVPEKTRPVHHQFALVTDDAGDLGPSEPSTQAGGQDEGERPYKACC